MKNLVKLQKNFDAVVFDIGGVLIDYSPIYLFKDYFDGSAEKTRDFIDTVFSSEWSKIQELRFYLDEGIKDLIQKFPEQKDVIQRFDDSWGSMIRGEVKENVEVLAFLKGKGFKLYALTNLPGAKLEYLNKRFSFMKAFDGVIASGIVGMRKPEDKIFELLLDRYNLTPQRVIFIDDNLVNIHAAQRVGLKSIAWSESESLDYLMSRI